MEVGIRDLGLREIELTSCVAQLNICNGAAQSIAVGLWLQRGLEVEAII